MPTSGAETALLGYLDTSALVPLLVSEPTSATCRRFWDDADTVVSCRLLYVEAAAALAQAQRMGRLTSRTQTASLRRLDDLWEQIDTVEFDACHGLGIATFNPNTAASGQ